MPTPTVAHSDAWRLIEAKLNKDLEKFTQGLTQMDNTREMDMILKGRIAGIKEILKLPQTLEVAAKTRGHND